jgi:hypothetical protein
MGTAHLDERENTPCGGHVRYDVNADDLITYSGFTDVAASRKCHDCTWHLICPESKKPEPTPPPTEVIIKLKSTSKSWILLEALEFYIAQGELTVSAAKKAVEAHETITAANEEFNSYPKNK